MEVLRLLSEAELVTGSTKKRLAATRHGERFSINPGYIQAVREGEKAAHKNLPVVRLFHVDHADSYPLHIAGSKAEAVRLANGTDPFVKKVIDGVWEVTLPNGNKVCLNKPETGHAEEALQEFYSGLRGVDGVEMASVAAIGVVPKGSDNGSHISLFLLRTHVGILKTDSRALGRIFNPSHAGGITTTEALDSDLIVPTQGITWELTPAGVANPVAGGFIPAFRGGTVVDRVEALSLGFIS